MNKPAHGRWPKGDNPRRPLGRRTEEIIPAGFIVPRLINSTAKVSPEYVLAIRAAHDGGMTLDQLTAKFMKLKRESIRAIITRGTWRNLK